MTTPSGHIPYTDRQALRTDFRAFIQNEAPIVRAAVKPAPVITVHPDRDLVALFRAHKRAPKVGGDCKVSFVLACDIPIPEADLAIKWTWTKPIKYTMTLRLQVPDCLVWLSPALQANVLACGLAPYPELGFLQLPLTDDLQERLVRVGVSILFHLQRRNASRN